MEIKSRKKNQMRSLHDNENHEVARGESTFDMQTAIYFRLRRTECPRMNYMEFNIIRSHNENKAEIVFANQLNERVIWAYKIERITNKGMEANSRL